MWAYLQMALDLLRMYSSETMTAMESVDAVALIDQGADLHAKTSHGYMPLHCACWNGNAEVAKVLLEKGADVHSKDSDGWTPLLWACRIGHDDIAAMLQAKDTVDYGGH